MVIGHSVVDEFFSQAEGKAIRVNEFSGPNAAYAIQMLRLALSHIDTPYRIEISTEDIQQ